MPLDKPDPEALRKLLEKYETLAVLRRDHAEGKPAPDRAVFQALAASFPGALAELDRLPIDVIAGCVESIKRALAGDVVEPWIPLMIGYHALSRAALSIRAASLKERVVSEKRARELAQETSSRSGIDVDEAFVRAVLAPPSGRLMDVVKSRLCVVFGVDEAAVAEALMRRRRPAK